MFTPSVVCVSFAVRIPSAISQWVKHALSASSYPHLLYLCQCYSVIVGTKTVLVFRNQNALFDIKFHAYKNYSFRSDYHSWFCCFIFNYELVQYVVKFNQCLEVLCRSRCWNLEKEESSLLILISISMTCQLPGVMRRGSSKIYQNEFRFVKGFRLLVSKNESFFMVY